MLPPPGYRTIELCGVGATSRVYRAISAKTGHVVALKRLHRQLAHSPETVTRLRREFEALSKLRHPGIVAVRDVIRWQGDPTVVMDFIPGVDLKERIQGERLEIEEVERIARAILDVLVVTHAAGIVHRDVKPQNIRLTPDGRVLLLDFGSARLEASSQLTTTGTTVGTPDYMAPELFAGSVYDPRVDIYGIGATLFECLTRRPPQVASSLTELAYLRTTADPPKIAELTDDVPPALAQVIDRCLARSPEDRHPSATLALWALDHAETERRFGERRSSQPLCLHCKSPIPPESVICAACGSDHPFWYQPGSSHVVIKSVKDPTAFARELIERFPERADGGHLAEITERCAGLSFETQRLLSFVDDEEATKLADDLEEHGVQLEVVEDEGTAGWRLYGFGLLTFLLTLFIVGSWVFDVPIRWFHALVLLAPPLLALVVDRLIAVAQGSQGILSDSRYPAAVAPSNRGAMATASVGAFGAGFLSPHLGFLFAEAGIFPVLVPYLELARAPFWVGGAAFLGVGLVSMWARYRRPRTPASGSPEPGLRNKLRHAFTLPPGARKRMRAPVAVALTAGVLSIVPVEQLGLAYVVEAVPTIETVWDVTREALVPAASVAPPSTPAVVAPPTPLSPFTEWVPGPAPPVVSKNVSTGPEPSTIGPVATAPFQKALGGGLILLALLGLIQPLRRRRSIRKEADEIFAELDFEQLARARLPPATRRADRTLTSADHIAQIPSSDAFLTGARRRAAELAHCLPRAEARRLGRALEELSRRSPPNADERSLLARSIVETDPEQRLRFELLLLEGQLEAMAAARWADRLGPAVAHADEDDS